MVSPQLELQLQRLSCRPQQHWQQFGFCLNQRNYRSDSSDNDKKSHEWPISVDLWCALHFVMKAKMLALTIVATKNRKPRFAFHVGFNPTQSELIMDLMRASHDDPEKADDRSLIPLSPTPSSEPSVTAELR